MQLKGDKDVEMDPGGEFRECVRVATSDSKISNSLTLCMLHIALLNVKYDNNVAI
jgi:hypothetical protein